MNGGEVRYCPECGAEGVGAREVTPNHVITLSCAHCGCISTLLWQAHDQVGTTAVHDPDSDTEAW